jgi:transaldolase
MRRYLLEQLSTMSGVVADTGDLHSIEMLRPEEATTNASLLTSAVQRADHAALVDEALRWARPEAGASSSTRRVVRLAMDRLAVEFGVRILQLVPGRVSTELDARLASDTDATVAKARKLITMYEAAGAPRERVLIKIVATWEGIEAARLLEQEGIRCNMTLLFGLHQAIACADAGCTMISPYVGRITDWYRAQTGRESFAPREDPGVLTVATVYNYLKHFEYPTQIMAASFRHVDQIKELAGCDLLTISPGLIKYLRESRGELPRRLHPDWARQMTMEAIHIDEPTFHRMHAENQMAHDKLSEGVSGFSKAARVLERILEERLAVVEGHEAVSTAARTMFGVFDLDGDGFITREEWAGTDVVFDAIDVNGDGRITPEEIAAALGAAYRLD